MLVKLAVSWDASRQKCARMCRWLGPRKVSAVVLMMTLNSLTERVQNNCHFVQALTDAPPVLGSAGPGTTVVT